MDGEIRVEILLRLVDLDVLDRVGILIERELVVGVLLVPMDLFDGLVVCLLLAEMLALRDVVEDGLRTMGVPTDLRVLIAPRERLEEVRGRETVVRLGVLLLDVIDLERLGVELRVDVLGALLRLGALGATERLGARVTALRDDELGGVALRLLLELLLFRELLDARAGSTANTNNKRTRVKNRKTCVLEC